MPEQGQPVQTGFGVYGYDLGHEDRVVSRGMGRRHPALHCCRATVQNQCVHLITRPSSELEVCELVT